MLKYKNTIILEKEMDNMYVMVPVNNKEMVCINIYNHVMDEELDPAAALTVAGSMVLNYMKPLIPRIKDDIETYSSGIEIYTKNPEVSVDSKQYVRSYEDINILEGDAGIIDVGQEYEVIMDADVFLYADNAEGEIFDFENKVSYKSKDLLVRMRYMERSLNNELIN